MFNQLLVLGQVPGTNFVITFYQFLLGCLILLVVLLRHKLAAAAIAYYKKRKLNLFNYLQKRRQLSLTL